MEELKCRQQIRLNERHTLDEYIKENMKVFEEFKNNLSVKQVIEYMNDYNIDSYEEAKQYLAEYLYFYYHEDDI